MRVWQERWTIVSGWDQPVGLKNPNYGRAGASPVGVFNGPVDWPANRAGDIPEPYPQDCFYEDDLQQPNLAAARVMALKTAIVTRLAAAVGPSGTGDPLGGVILRFDPNWSELDKAGADGPLRAPTASRMVKVFYNGNWVFPDVNVAPWNTLIDGAITIENYESRFQDLVNFLRLPMALNTYHTQVNATAPVTRNWMHRIVWTDIFRNSCCASCSTCRGGDCTASLESGGANLSIGLGSVASGGAGSMLLFAESPSAVLVSPLALDINLRAHVVSDVSGSTISENEAYIITSTVSGTDYPKQVYTPQGLVDVAWDGAGASGYTLYFYDKNHRGAYVDGQFSPSTSDAYRSVRVEAVGGDVSQIRITEGIDVSRETTFAFDAATLTWSLAKGSGAEEVTEMVSKAWVQGLGNAIGDIQVELSETRNAENEVVASALRRYQIFPWNANAQGVPYSYRGRRHELVEEIADPGTNARWTRYRYDETVEQTFTLNQSRPRLKQIERWDGTWTRYDYDSTGRVTSEYSSFNNAVAPASLSGTPTGDYRLTSYAYPETGVEQRTETIRFNGVTYAVGRSWSAISYPSGAYKVVTSETAVAPTAVRGDAKNLRSISRSLRTGRFAGETERVVRPDNTVSIFSYALDSATGQVTRTEQSGVSDNPLDPLSATRVVDGEQSVTVTNAQGQVISSRTYDIATGLLTSESIAVREDVFGRVLERVYLNGLSEMFEYSCCGLESTIDRTGLRTVYQYDSHKRVRRQTVYLGQSTTVYSDVEFTYDAAGRKLGTIEHSRGSSLDSSVPASIVHESNLYDATGELSSTTTPRGTTSFSTTVVGGRRQQTTTLPDLATRIESFDRAGGIEEVSGTAAAPVKIRHGVDAEGVYTMEIKVGLDYSATPPVAVETEWVKTYSDFAGRTSARVFPDGARETITYFDADDPVHARRGKLRSTESPPDSLVPGATGTILLYDYNARGEQTTTAIDMDQNRVIDYAGDDRISRVETAIVRDTNRTLRRTTTRVWQTSGSDVGSVIQTDEQEVDDTWSSSASHGVAATFEFVTYSGAGSVTRKVRYPFGLEILEVFEGDRIVSRQRGVSAAPNADEDKKFLYDGFGRLERVVDKRNGATTYTYFDDGLIKSATSPMPDETYARQTTSFTYDVMGRVREEVLPDNATVHYRYTSAGQLWRKWGVRTYPQETTYDPQGRVRTLATWSTFTGEGSFSSTTGKAVTVWNYDGSRGWLTGKRYNDGRGPTYSYYPSGKLRERLWVRGVATTYSYNTAGDPISIDYSDATPDVTDIVFDRLGRRRNVTDAAGVWTLGYRGATGLVESESVTGDGLLTGHALGRSHNSYLFVSGLSIPAISYTRANYYESNGRVRAVEGTMQGYWSRHDYTYKSYSDLLDRLTQSGGSYGYTRQTTYYGHDYLGRLRSIAASSPGGRTVSSNYRYNEANQRVRNSDSAGVVTSYWDYAYDELGQVSSATKRNGAGEDLPGFMFEYDFDTIGNRTNTVTNGRESIYQPDAEGLNQYAERSVPGVVDVVGTADLASYVTANLQPAQRSGEYFWASLEVDNSSAPVWQPVSVVGSVAATNGASRETGFRFVPSAAESFAYDDDGNLTHDDRWSYAWDAENRLTGMETLSSASAVGVPRQRLTFNYDGGGRRIRKLVESWTGDAYQAVNDIRFAYDGWNLVSERDLVVGTPGNRAYMWGLDLSGGYAGAGGVGGLLAIACNGVTLFPAYDGNGNVVALTNAPEGQVRAEFEFGAFGETLRSTGPAEPLCPIRFSSKYTDAETGLLYYGFRYYNPSTGRWLSRDPIEEQGGVNLYGMVGNDAINDFDWLGLWSARGLVEFLCRTKDGREFLQGIRNRMSQGWSFKTFDEMETDLYYTDGSTQRIRVPGVNGYTDKTNKIIYLRTSSASDESAAKSLIHEIFHSTRLPNRTRSSLQNEEADVYALTDAYAKHVGYPRDPDIWTKGTIDRAKIAKKYNLPLAVATPVPSTGPTAYSGQLEKLPKKDPTKAKKPQGTHGAFPTYPNDLILEIEKYCPCALDTP